MNTNFIEVTMLDGQKALINTALVWVFGPDTKGQMGCIVDGQGYPIQESYDETKVKLGIL